MLLNYLKLSLRLLGRNPFFSFVTIIGLAIGFASFYALWSYSINELRSDQYHDDAEKIARIGVNWNWTDDGGKTWDHLKFGFCKANMLPRLIEDFPEVVDGVRVLHQTGFLEETVHHDNKVVISLLDARGSRKSFRENNVAYADANLFRFFTIPLLYGHPSEVLKEANDVVLSHSTALKYFGNVDPTGELITLNDTTTLRVSGVFQDLPSFTHLRLNVVISNKSLITTWSTVPFAAVNLYVKLNEPSFTQFEHKINTRIDGYWSDVLGSSTHLKVDMFVQPLAEIPFSKVYVGDYFTGKSRPFLLTLAFIAISILVMGWANYVNLAVTRTSQRFKELATRRVSGAKGSDILRQFVMESLVVNVVAVALAFTLIQLLKAPVSLFFNIHIPPLDYGDVTSTWIPVALITTGILLSGLYPAIASTRYQPRILYQRHVLQTNKRIIPNILTVGQFIAAIILISLGFNISNQLNYILAKDIGLRKDNAIIVPGPVVKPANYLTLMSSLRNELAGTPGVSDVTNTKFTVNRSGGGEFNVRRVGSDMSYGTESNSVDENFISFYGLKTIAGRSFTKNDAPDAIVISRFAATRLGFKTPDDAIGADIELALHGTWNHARIIGVIDDFRVFSFLNMSESSTESNNEGRGMVLMHENNTFNKDYFAPEVISIRIEPKEFDKTMAQVERLYKESFPDTEFSWTFLDDLLTQIYTNEKVARNQVILFTGLAILIACLGVFGMISNKVAQKTKEIGIRKILGANLSSIARILLSSTVTQVGIATCIGIPLGYRLTLLYLDRFSERVAIEWWHFTIPVVIFTLILLCTITSVLFKAAKNNPVDALKYE